MDDSHERYIRHQEELVGISIKTEAAQMALEVEKTRMEIAKSRMRPSVLMQPTIYWFKGQWYCIRGSFKNGVKGCGQSPEEACAAFDIAWTAIGPPPGLEG
jgi:hypothetical protein